MSAWCSTGFLHLYIVQDPPPVGPRVAADYSGLHLPLTIHTMNTIFYSHGHSHSHGSTFPGHSRLSQVDYQNQPSHLSTHITVTRQNSWTWEECGWPDLLTHVHVCTCVLTPTPLPPQTCTRTHFLVNTMENKKIMEGYLITSPKSCWWTKPNSWCTCEDWEHAITGAHNKKTRVTCKPLSR